jgi:hypothetical protein
MFMAVWDAWEDVASPDDLPTTDKHVREFMEALSARGYNVRLGLCSPHEWNDESVCMTCGEDSPASPADAWRRLREAVLPGARFVRSPQKVGKTEALMHHLFIHHDGHVITVRAPALRVDGTGPTAGYLFCRECDGDVDLSAPCAVCDPAIARVTR